jgi:phospholipid transport system substrate-binding protein
MAVTRRAGRGRRDSAFGDTTSNPREFPMRRHLWNATVILLILNTGICSAGYAAQPLAVLGDDINSFLAVLNDPQFADHRNQALQLRKLRQLLDQAFDFDEFSRRVLADNWHKFTPQQQREFVDAFAEFLSKFYMKELQKQYTDETVKLTGQRLLQADKAVVTARVFLSDIGIPVEVYMSNRSGKWKVYDISALSISAVLNYRAQFDEILQKESPSQVIAKLRKKPDRSASAPLPAD